MEGAGEGERTRSAADDSRRSERDCDHDDEYEDDYYDEESEDDQKPAANGISEEPPKKRRRKHFLSTLQERAADEAGKEKEDVEPYYAFFDSRTNNGVVFNEDLSSLEDLPEKSLTKPEKTARKAWVKTRAEIVKHYASIGWPEINDTNSLLAQRILAPCLVYRKASSRSKPAESRCGRRYPAKLSPWRSFPQEVAKFVVTRRSLEDDDGSPFKFSADTGDGSIEVRDERQEELFLVGVLNRYCGKSHLIGQVVSAGPVIGQPDVMVMKVHSDDEESDEESNESAEQTIEDVGVLCEFKSTHNLPLSMFAQEVCDTYNEAYAQVYDQKAGRTTGWSRTCHPIGQLLGYMVDNKKRFGILSSATRTYFLRIRKVEDKEVVEISDAMFVGQANYMKAWVYVHQLDGGDALDTKSLGWQRTTTTKTTPRASSGRGGSSRSKKDETSGRPANSARHSTGADASDTAASDTAAPGTTAGLSVLPSVPFSEIRIISALGQGRNGTVFLADWREQKVALKQFDMTKRGRAYEQEVKSYMRCQRAWGRLVPTPFFVSESWSGGARFLALQLGRPPRSGDDVSMWYKILDALEEECGIRHEDCDDKRNMLFIPHGEKERLVAVDLEDITNLQ